jgi:hypothetical protein
VAYEGGDYVEQATTERNQSERRARQEEKMAHQKRAHSRKLEHRTSMLHDDGRTVSLEDSPCSPEPQEETQRNAQRMVKSSEE